MSERNLIGAFIASREAFDRIAEHLEEGDLTEQARVIVNHLESYYSRDPEAAHADPDLLARDVSRSMSNPKHRETFDHLIKGISAEQVSPANVVHDYISVKREAVGHRLASMLAAGRAPEEVRPMIALYEDWATAQDLDEEEDEVWQGASVADLVRTSYEEGALTELWPPALNERLDGGLLPGHHVVLFARPEMGKTMFLVNAIAGFLSQERTVLYIGNEDPLADVVIRVVSRLTGMTKHDILADPDTADAGARANGYDNLILASLTPGSPREIEALCVKYKPDVLMIDQLRNLNTGDENFVIKMDRAAQAARNLGKKHDMVVLSVTQAGDSASGRAVLDMGDCDFSNTGVPASCDVMIGMGATSDDEAMGRRVLTLCKNKRGGNHDAIPVNVDPHTSSIGG